MKLRDIELRLPESATAPPGFFKTSPAQSAFCRGLRALQIDTPGIAKINVCCDPDGPLYRGEVFDGVTDVHLLKKGRTPIAELPVCTTFPAFEYAVDNFVELTWETSSRLTAVFEVHGAAGHEVFGRRNFQSDAANVKVTESKDGRTRGFTIDISLASRVTAPGQPL